MEKRTFTLDSSDGKSKLSGFLFLPEGHPRAVVQICHGMCEYILRYEELAQHLTHPSHHVNKTYLVEVRGRVPEEKLDLLRLGVPLEDGLTAPAMVYVQEVDEARHVTRFTITIHEGRNRQVRRMCDFIGFPVKHLKRIQVGSLTLEGMKKGQYRDLTPEELADLEKEMEGHE